MVGQMSRTTPEIRFEKYIDDWKQCELGEVLEDMYNGQTPSRFKEEYWNGKIRWLSSGELNRGIVNSSIETITELGQKSANLKIVPEGTFVMAITGLEAAGTRGNCAILGCKTTLNQSCMALYPKESMLDSNFLFQWYKLVGEDYGIKYTQGTKQQSYNAAIISSLKICLPQKDEQVKIAESLESIDKLIALHRGKLERYISIKKSMLTKMFPQNGEKVPRIRFSGFNDDWEKCKFSDIATTRRGLTYKPNDIVDDGKRVLRSSNINEDTFEIYEDDIFVDEKAVNIPYVKNGDILITSANGSNRLVGKHTIIHSIPDNSAVHGGFMLLASSDEPQFVNALMNSQWYTKFINVYVAGGNGAIGNLNKNDLDEQIVLVPSKYERERIGMFFSRIDNLIILNQQKIEKLENMKKTILKRMLVYN